jgi:acetylornithine deacetylase/succinyl-diaminopimelate desuccinylase-like protein
MTQRIAPGGGLATLALLLAGTTAAQPADLRDRIRAHRERNEVAIVRELADLLALPNVASNLQDIHRNADHLIGMLQRRGIEARKLELDGAAPAVFGELRVPGAARTVMLYAHYDGQPVNPARWATPAWTPVLRSGSLADGAPEIPLVSPTGRYHPESRLYARSASDDKSPIVAILWALDALRAGGTGPSVNLKFFLEGEEEAGSTHLREMLTRYRDLLAADLWIFADGPVHQSREPQVVFGVRGDVGADLTVYGPIRPLHSGHYGNWAPNPNVMLVHLLASMRDQEGRVTIPGFYDDVRPMTEAERAAFASVPPVEDQLRGELRLGRTEGGGRAGLLEQIALPAINLSGLSGGLTGEGSANLIGSEASAFLDIRLVPAQTPERVKAQLERHITRQGFHIVREEPDSATRRAFPRLIRVTWGEGYPAARTGFDAPAVQALLRAAEAATAKQLIRVPTSGGSLPLYHFEEVLRTPFVMLPIVNHDNNQHGENENLRLQNLWDGIELFGGLLERLGREWRSIP